MKASAVESSFEDAKMDDDGGWRIGMLGSGSTSAAEVRIVAKRFMKNII